MGISQCGQRGVAEAGTGTGGGATGAAAGADWVARSRATSWSRPHNSTPLRWASVLEIPLGDIDPAGRLPLHLAVADVDRDGHPDLLVTPGDNGPVFVYLLDTGKGALHPPTAEEQRRLVLPGRER
jgi:hypothetical protein